MRRSIVGVVMLAGTAFGTAVLAAPGGASDETTELDCSILEVRALLGTDLTGLSDHDLRLRVNQVMHLADRVLDRAASKALDGTIDDVRTFLTTGWEAPYAHDLRIRVGVIMNTASPELRAEANAVLDANTVEALEEFLAKEECKPRDPVASTTSTTSTSAPPATTPTTVAGQPGSPAVAPPATPVPGRPAFTG